jgi:hypothetical protein
MQYSQRLEVQNRLYLRRRHRESAWRTLRSSAAAVGYLI